MKLPPLLLGLAFALWGRCADLFWLGVLLGIALESLSFARLQRTFDNADLNRVSDLATLLSVGAVLYFIATAGLTAGLLRAVVWLPVTTLPVLFAQLVSAAGHLHMRNLFYSLRRSPLPAADRPIDLGYPYFALILLAASVATTRQVFFLPSIVVIIAYALFAIRPRNCSLLIWGALAAISLGMGIVLSSGLHHLQSVLEDFFIEWLSAPASDPYRTRTRIGDVGHIKLSDAIVWRVRSDRPLTGPLLLVDAGYTYFDGTTWRAHNDAFRPVRVSDVEGNFILGENTEPLAEIWLSGYSDNGRALIALPPATHSIVGLISGTVSVNPLGAVKIAEAAPLLRLRVTYTPQKILRLSPTVLDSEVPKSLAPLFAQVRNQILLPSSSTADIIQGVRRFFGDNFQYSLYLGNNPGGKDLRNFLTESRSGHCEYFATATTLLLRSFGVPARYITGYSVHEFVAAEHQYVARYRHAHAWAQAYVDGVWQDVDTTPGTWVEAEADQRNSLEPIIDWFSWQWYHCSKWRAGNAADFYYWQLGGVLFVCGWLYWRLFRRPRISGTVVKRKSDLQAKTSAYFQMEAGFARAGYLRPIGETPHHWLQRLEREGCSYFTETARALVQTHYRFEYQPNTDKTELSAHLQELVERWRSETDGRMAGHHE
ncbi:protein-glutamine gamma-glutamyltransferase [Gammaproteobacteria bacterium]